MPTTTAAAVHIVSSIKATTDTNDGQTDPGLAPAMLLAFAIVSTVPAKITSIRSTVERGKRYRLVMNNNSGDTHPVHLHRHTFEMTKVGDKATSGVMKDTISMPRYSRAEIDFMADDPGNTLFHCHHQDHMDEGFAGIITYT